MFDTERFVLEVQNRPCLWDSREKYGRSVKKPAWEEIGSLLYKNWDGETENKQRELVDELQRKWKHLRDYYVKEKKLEEVSGTAPKKRKTSYVDMLQFLDVLKEPRTSSGNISSPVTDHTENSCDEALTYTNSQPTLIIKNSKKADEMPGPTQIKNKTKMAAVQTCSNLNIEQPPKEYEDADSKFLLSLLPQMKSLNERQNFEFRIEVMNSLYKFKYRTPYNVSHDTHPYEGYTYEPAPAGYTVDVAPPVYPSSNLPTQSPEHDGGQGQSSAETKSQKQLRKSTKYIKIETDLE